MPDTSRVSFHFLTFFWTTLVQSDPKFMPQTQQILPRFYRHLSWDGLIASVPDLVPNINWIASKTCILDSVIRDLSTMDWSGTILSGKTFWTKVHYLFFAIPKSILIRFWQSITLVSIENLPVHSLVFLVQVDLIYSKQLQLSAYLNFASLGNFPLLENKCILKVSIKKPFTYHFK